MWCRAEGVPGGGGKGDDRLLCCNKNTWIYSPSFQCWTEFCYIMRKETPSTDVGRVLIIGELHRKQTTESWGGRWGEGLLQSYLHFTQHDSSSAVSLHTSWGVRKKTKQNKTKHWSTSCLRRTHSEAELRRSARFGSRSPYLVSSYMFYIVLSDYKGKCKESEAWTEVCR